MPIHFTPRSAALPLWSPLLLVGSLLLSFGALLPALARSADGFFETSRKSQDSQSFNSEQEWAPGVRIAQAPTNEKIMDPDELYQLLEVAVAQQNWTAAISIVETLQVLQPERALELEQYRQRLQALAGSPTPAPFSLSQPGPAGRTGDPRELPAKIVIQNAKGRVKTYRFVRQGDFEVTYPETYQIDITFQSPQGYAAQQIPVQITVNSFRFRPLTFSQEVVLGTPRSREIQVEFSTSQEPNPRSVTVKVAGGQEKTFPLSLPSSSEVVGKRLVN